MGRNLVAISLLAFDLCGSTYALSQLRETLGKKVTINVVVRSPVTFTQSERQKLRAKIRQFRLNEAEDIAEIVRELYQDKGFFRADVVTVQPPTAKKNVLVLRVNPGKRYYLVRITWRGNAFFSESELANLILFTPGELFNRTKIARGLEAARKLYYSRGFINYAGIPDPEVDDDAATIAFEMDVDEGVQFRFGELQVEGMEEAHREMLLSAWQRLRGRPYNVDDADAFFNHYFRSPGPDVRPENYTIRKVDEASRSVNYSLQFDPSLRYRVKGSRLEPVETP